MVPMILAGVLGAGIAGVVGFGLVAMALRRKTARIEDYPELPAPSAFEAGDTDRS